MIIFDFQSYCLFPRRMNRCIYQLKNWPQFTWRHEDLISTLGKVRHLQGKFLRKEAAGGRSTSYECERHLPAIGALKFHMSA